VGGGLDREPERRHAATTGLTAAYRIFWPRLLAFVPLLLLLLASVHGAVSAPEQRPRPVQNLQTVDPIVIVESFLAARNAGDALGATAFCADLLAINGADGQSWLGDAPAVKSWLEQFSHAYWIDMLERPRVDGEHVAWTERLTTRSMPFKDALSSRLDVRVEVLVRDGKITTYSTWYPTPAPKYSVPINQPLISPHLEPGPASLPPVTIFLLAAFGVLLAGVLLLTVLPAVFRAGPTSS
jgi:hypothetical protein